MFVPCIHHQLQGENGAAEMSSIPSPARSPDSSCGGSSDCGSNDTANSSFAATQQPGAGVAGAGGGDGASVDAPVQRKRTFGLSSVSTRVTATMGV